MIEEFAKEYIAFIPNLFGSFTKLNKDSTGLSHMQNHVIEYIYMQNRAINLKKISNGFKYSQAAIDKCRKGLGG